MMITTIIRDVSEGPDDPGASTSYGTLVGVVVTTGEAAGDAAAGFGASVGFGGAGVGRGAGSRHSEVRFHHEDSNCSTTAR
jgi:hypothetical protein